MSTAHPGFQALVAQGVPAGALANGARNASPAAKAKNPRLLKVNGAKKGAKRKAKKPVSKAAKRKALAGMAAKLSSQAAGPGPMLGGLGGRQ